MGRHSKRGHKSKERGQHNAHIEQNYDSGKDMLKLKGGRNGRENQEKGSQERCDQIKGIKILTAE